MAHPNQFLLYESKEARILIARVMRGISSPVSRIFHIIRFGRVSKRHFDLATFHFGMFAFERGLLVMARVR